MCHLSTPFGPLRLLHTSEGAASRWGLERGRRKNHAEPGLWPGYAFAHISWSCLLPQLLPHLLSSSLAPRASCLDFCLPYAASAAFSHTLSPHLLTLKLAWSLWRSLPRVFTTGNKIEEEGLSSASLPSSCVHVHLSGEYKMVFQPLDH